MNYPRWLTPDWPAPAHVRALSTWRGGGVSLPPYDSLNLGDHVADAPSAVAANRLAVRTAAGLPAEPCWLNQVHGTDVFDLDAAAGAELATQLPPAAAPRADAAVTRQPHRICAILTADCLPVLLTSTAGDRVGAAHAGWRGLAGGVIEAAVRALGGDPRDLMAWLGPGIGPGHFEVGAEVREALLEADTGVHGDERTIGAALGAQAAFTRNARGRFMADLPALARRRLAQVGVTRVYGGGLCTYADPTRYFSHRRDGITGRQATLIWLDGLPDR